MKLRPLIPILIVAAGILAYHNSFQGPFIFDDLRWIPENPSIRHLWPIWDVLSPRSSELINGRPVVNLSLGLNYALGGYNVWGYHALNLAIHILAGVTLFGVLRRTLLQPALRERFGAVADELALAVAIIWTVHPLQTESVTYVIQRAESLMGLCYLLTLYCFIRSMASSRPRLWRALCVGVCALGMACKEVMVSAPVMVLLYDRAFVSGSFQQAWRRQRLLYLWLSATWVLLGFMVIFAGTFAHASVMARTVEVTRWDYLTIQPGVILYYLRLAAWPYPLCFDYYGWPVAGTGLSILPPMLVIAMLLAATVWTCRSNSAWGFLGAWFFLILAPSSSLIPLDSPAYEHRMYLSLAAVVTIVVVGAVALGKRLFDKQQGVAFGCVAAGLVVALLTSMTIQRNRDYNSALAIWQDTVEKRPNNARAHSNLGNALLSTGDAQAAIGHFEQALRLRPNYVEAHYNLGLALVRLGRVPEAIGHYEQALRLEPELFQAESSLGDALLQVGEVQEAIGHEERAVRLRPDYAEAHKNLGNALLRAGKVQEAIGQYEQTLQFKPDDTEALDNLGNALARLGRAPEAIEHYEQALRIRPDFAEAHNNLGNALLRAGKVPEAIGHFEQALRIKPDFAEGHYNLANSLIQLGRVQEAIGHYEQALRIKPDFVQARSNLALARALP